MGIAKLHQASVATTTCRSPSGTYPYMAPEMFGSSVRGTAVDVYSLGCLYIELFGRKRVWPGLDGMQIMQKVCGAFNIPPVMPSIDHIPDEYKQICNACCQLQMEEQPTIQGVIQILHNLD